MGLQVVETQSYTSLLWAPSLFTILILWYVCHTNPLSKAPLVTGKSFWDFSGKKAKENFTVDARNVVKRGFQMVGVSKPFRVISDLGELLILPPSLADDIRNIDQLSHAEFMKEMTCAHIAGFEPFLESTGSTLLADVTKTKLMGNLNRLTTSIAGTAALACKDLLPVDQVEWHEVVLKETLLDMVARLSASIFLGDEEVTHNARWLQITKEYTVDSFIAAHQLKVYPKFLWPVAAWYLPLAQKVKAQLKEAEQIITPVINRRRAEVASAKMDSHGKVERQDSIQWLEQTSKEKKIKYSPTAMQLTLALSAIHTTTDLLTTTMYELLQNPEVIPLLRDEIISVLGDGGLKHSSLYNLKLMDSAIKEAQRLKPALSVNMVRKATSPITLPTGLHLPTGTRLGVSAHASWDPTIFPNPDKFDAARFLRLREQPGNEHSWQLTTTRPEQIAFGHGKHACPGRFLAANEVKIALCHLLMKYEWRMAEEGTVPKVVSAGIMLDSDPTVRVLVRGRRSEVKL